MRRILGNGTPQAGDVMRFGFPRTDLRVTVDGVTLKPALALGSWAAFRRDRAGADSVTVMGDLVLTEGEVNGVVTRLQSGGIEQSALHNHVLRESPRIMYLHIFAHGKASEIAETLRNALRLTGTPLGSGMATQQATLDLDTSAIHHALGYAGRVNGGVLQVSIPRPEPIAHHGVDIVPAMGVGTAINFQPTGSGKAAITGDFVLAPAEVNPVIRALRTHNIEITALHSHMLDESPRLFFMHFWANADATALARGLRAALDETAIGKARR